MSLESVFRLSVIVNMIDRLTGPITRVTSVVDNTSSRVSKLNQGLGTMTKTGVGMSAVGAGITNTVLKPITATFSTRKALGTLSSMGVKDFNTLEKAAKSFSDQWAGTSKAEFLSAAVDIKGGIDSLTDEGVAGYTEIAGITAKATNATIDEMTSLFATGYGIYKDYYDDLSDFEFAEMFSAGLADAILVFKASGESMSQAIQALGGSATTANVPLEEQLSILGMLQATMSGSEAGTKYRAFLRTVAKAGDELKLPFLDANKQLRSMPEILQVLKSKYGETLDAMEKQEIQKAFGSDEAIALLDLMYSKTDVLQSNILEMYGAMGQGTALTREMASAINETEPDRYTRLGQAFQNITEQIGNLLLPTFNSVVDKGGEVLTSLSGWIENNQDLAKGLAITAIVLGVFLTGAGALSAGIGALGIIITKVASGAGLFYRGIKGIPDLLRTIHIMSLYAGDGLKAGLGTVGRVSGSAVRGIRSVTVATLGMARQAIITAVTAMPGLIASVWSFTAALLANPITWVVIGIVALIAALILLWQNWDAVVAWVQASLGGFINGIVAGFGAFQTGIQGIKDYLSGVPAWFRESGKKIITTFTEGIQSTISAPVEAVKGALGRIRNLLPFSDAKEGPLSELTLSGRRVFETINSGMIQTQSLPADTTEAAFQEIDLNTRGEQKKINLREIIQEKSESTTESQRSEKGTYIDKLQFNVDLKNLKDLPMLFKLLKEIEDYINANGSDPEPNPA